MLYVCVAVLMCVHVVCIHAVHVCVLLCMDVWV